MAEIITKTRVDDLDGTASDDVEPVRFSFHSENLIIDLSEENRAAFEEAISPYLNAARKDTLAGVARSRNSYRSAPTHSKEYLAKVRAWAVENDIEVSSRGRIKKEIMEAYDAAN